MIYILEFVFSDNKKKTISYTTDSNLPRSEIEKKLNCEFINSITECEPNTNGFRTKLYNNIKIPFPKSQFIDYLNDKNYIELLGISNFFGNDEKIKSIITEKIKNCLTVEEKIGILNALPVVNDNLLHICDQRTGMSGVLKYGSKYYDISNDSGDTIDIEGITYQKRYLQVVMALRDSSSLLTTDKKSEPTYLIDFGNFNKEIYELVSTNKIKNNAEHCAKLTKIFDNQYDDIGIIGIINFKLLDNDTYYVRVTYDFADDLNNFQITAEYRGKLHPDDEKIYVKCDVKIHNKGTKTFITKYYYHRYWRYLHFSNRVFSDDVQKHFSLDSLCDFNESKYPKISHEPNSNINLTHYFDNDVLAITMI